MEANDSPYAALKMNKFRLLLAGRFFVSVAVQIQAVAIGWQIYSLTKDPLYLGLAGLSEAFPAISIALYAGHINDIMNRKLIAILSVCTLLISFTLLSILSAGYLSSYLVVLGIYCINALTGLARGFYAPAIFGLISDIVPRELYGNAIAWNTALWQISAISGPCLGGFLYVFWGASKTYLFSSFLMLISLTIFSIVKVCTYKKAQHPINALANIREGLQFVFANQVVLAAMTLDLFAVLFGGAVALLPIFTSEIFHCGPQMLGLLRAAPSIGALLTASVLTHKPLARNAGLILLLACAGFGISMICFGLSTNLYLSLFLLIISGALDGVSVWVRNTIFQLATPNNMKGRVAAVNSIFVQSSNEIGEFESGFAAKLIGLVPSVVLGGCMTLFVVLITAIKSPKLRKLHLHSLYENFESNTS